MGRKLTPFTLDQHKDVGKKLWDIDDYLCSLSVAVGNAYGASEMDRLIKIRNLLSVVRSNLENELAGENPTLEHPNFIYYHVDNRPE